MSEIDLSKSVHHKLMNKAKETNRPFNELLQYYAMERFLYRLSNSRYSDRFILKGALMFFLWDIPGMQARPTRDIDLLGIIDNDPELLKVVFSEICKTPVEDDGVRFNPDRTDPQKQVQWKAFIRKTGLSDAADFNDTVSAIEGFIKPVLMSILEKKQFTYKWDPRGPWEFHGDR